MKFFRRHVLCVLGLGFCTQLTCAQTLPGVQYGSGPVYAIGQWSGSGSASGTSFSGDQEFSVTGPGTYAPSINGGSEVASANLVVAIAPDPTLSLTASATSMPTNTTFNGSIAEAGANVTLSYSLEVLGPSGTVGIMTNATVSAALSAIPASCWFSLSGPCTPQGNGPNQTTTNVSSSASLTVTGGGQETVRDYVTVGPQGGYTQNTYGGQRIGNSSSWSTGLGASLADNRVWMAQTNTLYTVTLGVTTTPYLDGFYGAGTITGSAIVDPTFQLASTDANPGAYSIVFSNGVGNASPVPLPPSAWMLLSGMAGVSTVVCRRRRTRAQI